MASRARIAARLAWIAALGAWIAALGLGFEGGVAGGWALWGAGLATGSAVWLQAREQRGRNREIERYAEALCRDPARATPLSGEGDASWRAMARALGRVAISFGERFERESEVRERLETIIATLEEAFLVVARDGRILFANQRAGDWFAMPEDPVGHQALEVVREQGFLRALGAALEGEAQSGELRLGAVDPLSIRFRVAPYSAGGEVAGAVALFHDISELRRAEAARSDFLANASHELKTPLSSVQGYAELLADRDNGDPTSKRAIEAIQSNAKRLAALVEDLLELSEIEGGTSPHEVQRFDAAQLVGSLLGDLEARAKTAKLEIGLDTQGATELVVDRRAFEQVVGNLVDNALKYTPEGGAVWVWIGPGRDAERLRVEVRDNGPGISLRHHHRVFERFYRVDPGRSREVGGTGLGLAIAKHRVQEGMGGEIGLESEPGLGSRFWFEVPRQRAAGTEESV